MAVDRDLLNLTFGRSNVDAWADLDNDKNAADITARVTYAIAWSIADIASRLNGKPTPPDGNASYEDVIAKNAGVWLCESRGTPTDGTKTPVAHHKEYVRNWIAAYTAGSINYTLPIGPFVA